MTTAPRGLQKSFHRLGYQFIVGVDEAGRGPLAGPVVAAAVILAPEVYLAGVNDSKALSSARREELFSTIVSKACAYGIGVVSPAEIDEINILQATFLAMVKAINHTNIFPDLVVVDGRQRLPFPLCQYPLVKADSRCQVVAAASIIAKVIRDRIMQFYHLRYPFYGFDRHKGYGTAVHRQALNLYGLSPVHRRSFRLKEQKVN
ncbi:MAG: ribonuclease HII [Deltaproteobacteria bacterium]|nr:ribonuclease HII [Candidatus Tharpellaceae bacterium]